MNTNRFRLKLWLKEPLVHFLLLGACLFLLFHLLGNQNTQNPDKIIVTQGKIENLIESFRKRWLRPPSERELKGLVEDHIKEEVLYREAVAMGLDKDDTIIRRRMRQKMQFLFEDVAAQAEPTEEELQEYLDKNAAYFRIEPRFTFMHVYLNPDRHGESFEADAGSLLEKLKQSSGTVDIEALGDPIMLSRTHDDVSQTEVGKLFGEDFAQKLLGLQTGQWQGPIESGYGIHFVLLRSRIEGRIPALDEVRDTVKRELQNIRRKQVNEATYRRLLERYRVVIEPLKAADGEVRAEEAR
jgi:hypothetical protein